MVEIRTVLRGGAMLTIRELRDRAVIRPVKRAVEDDLLDLPGVTAVDIGEKRRAGRDTGEQAIIVSVGRKRSPAQIPVGARIPSDISGVPTDVLEEEPVLWHIHCQSGQGLAWPPTQRTSSSMAGGLGITPARLARLTRPQVPGDDEYHRIGTLGVLVAGEVATMGLTTFDVACLDDAWSVGDRMVEPLRGEAYAELDRAALSGRVDAAAVSFEETSALAAAPFVAPRRDDGDERESRVGLARGSATAYPGARVSKLGFGTGLTHGAVSSIDASVRVDHGDALGVRILREQLRIVATSGLFCGAGDAGAAVVDPVGRIVGLHVAGSCTGRVGFANPISDVLHELDVRLCVADEHVRA